jgi:hypothetical protein
MDLTITWSSSASASGRVRMPKTVLWLIIIFTILFVIGVNSGELAYLMNLGNTI